MTMTTHPAREYPSPAEVKIYIGQAWVDDAYRVDYSVSNNRVPLYDYTSPFFKTVAEGNHLVQGQLIINFRFPGYLKRALLNDLFYDSNYSNSVKTQTNIARDILNSNAAQRLDILLAAKRLGTFEATKQVSEDLFIPDREDGSDGLPELKKDPAVSHSKTPFDIIIKYGGEESLYDKIIEDCYILGESQVISASALAGGDLGASGMPIFEVYSFLGRKLSDRITTKGSFNNLKSRVAESTTPTNTAFGRI